MKKVPSERTDINCDPLGAKQKWEAERKYRKRVTQKEKWR